MSFEFLGSFFPHTHAFIEQHAPAFLDRAFPPWVRERCPEPRYDFQLPGGVAFRHISLLPLQLAGMAIGAAALRRTVGFWRWGFAAFALMNLFSIFAHDLSSTGTAIWRVGATGDVVCTGITNTCVILAARGQADSRVYDGRGPGGTAIALGIAAAAAVAGYGFGEVPFVHEALYIGTSAAAFFCCLFLLVLPPANSWAERRWLNLASLGAAIMLGCVWTDRALCAAFGSVFNFVHLLFLGCDIVFFAFLVLYSGAGELKKKQT